MNATKANQANLVARIAAQNKQDVLVKETDLGTMYACTFSQYEDVCLENQVYTKRGKLLIWGVKKMTKTLDLLVVYKSDWRTLEESVKGLLNINAPHECDDMDFIMVALSHAPEIVIEDIVKYTRREEYVGGISSKELASWLLLY